MEQVVSLTGKKIIHKLIFGAVRKGQWTGIGLHLYVSYNHEEFIFLLWILNFY